MGCRARDLAARLVRVALADTTVEPPTVVVDSARRLPGRGAWLHPDPKCLDLAERRRAFTRALRLQGPVDTRAVHAQLESLRDAKAPGTSPG